MILFGVDPGTARLGWAVIQVDKSVIKALDYGCIETAQSVKPEDRLLILFNNLTTLIQKHKPDYLALEELYFGTNAKTVIPVAQARGIVLLSAAKQKIPVASYTPLVVKQTITGSGSADKTQVGKMVIRLLKLSRAPALDDTTDALAIALTHAYSYRLKQKTL